LVFGLQANLWAEFLGVKLDIPGGLPSKLFGIVFVAGGADLWHGWGRGVAPQKLETEV
jgi:hypothetical protein